QPLALRPPSVEPGGRHFGEPMGQLAIGGPQRPVGALHLVERDRHGSPVAARLRRFMRTARLAILAASGAPTQGGPPAVCRAPCLWLLPMIWAPADFSYGANSFLTCSTTGRGVA